MEAFAGQLAQAVSPAAGLGSTGSGRNSRTGSGTRFSGAPLWRFTLRRDEHRRTLDGHLDHVAAPEGFVHQSDGWHWNSKHNIFWRSSTCRFYRYNASTKAYDEISEEASLDKELRLVTDASCVHKQDKFREDRHVIVRDLAKAAQALKMPIDHLAKPVALFAVYTGHRPQPPCGTGAGYRADGGTDSSSAPPTCAEFCARNFHLKLLPRLSEFKGPWDSLHLATALRDSCQEIDSEFLARPGGASDGCSAVIALLTGRRLFIASIGDAVAYVGEESELGELRISQLSVTHSVAIPSELSRIKHGGGMVVKSASSGQLVVKASRGDDGDGDDDDDVGEVLHVSRAFGDRAFKECPSAKDGVTSGSTVAGGHGAPAAPSLVIPIPDVSNVMLHSGHQVVVLASGELSTLRESEIADIMSKCKGRPRVASGGLLHELHKKGIAASMTALSVFLDWNTKVGRDAEHATKRARTEASSSQAKSSQVRCRQILVKHRDCREPVDRVRGGRPVTRSLAEAERVLLETLAAIESSPGRSVFTQRCKAVSECDSCLKGGEMAGDLGWISRGQRHPAVEAAAFALPVGHISDIVESDEGVHVLWRIA